MDGEETTRRQRTRAGRRILFRLGAIALVVLPLALIEIAVRLFAPSPPVTLQDPYVSFQAVKPLFVPDAAGQRLETAPERLEFFRHQSFQAVKPANGFRIFCLGGSTVQGRPYAVETAFTTRLLLDLKAADPGRAWEVVNCGGVSYASYRLVPILQEVLGCEPDLIVLYAGHNEFLEDRTYGRLKRTPSPLLRLHRGLRSLRSYALAEAWLAGRAEPQRAVLPAEVKARLDYREGLASYHRDDAWRVAVIEHYRRNMERMVGMCQAAGVPVIFVNPVSNVGDCHPFKSQFSATASPTHREQAADLMQHAEAAADPHERLALLQEAAAIDDRHAGLLYRLGACCEQVGRPAEAKQWFLRAKEEDVCSLRMLEAMHEVLHTVARRCDVPVVDARELIEKRSEGGIAGDEWLLDHVHPRIQGHALIGDALCERMATMGLVVAAENWRQTRESLWTEHLKSLPPAYWSHGADRLRRLHEWSRGRIPSNGTKDASLDTDTPPMPPALDVSG